MSGSMNIFKSRIRSSPGKLIRVMDCGVGLANRPRNPRIRPTKTAAIVKTKSMFSLNQSTTYVHVQNTHMNENNESYQIISESYEWDIKKLSKEEIDTRLTRCNLSSGVIALWQIFSSSTVVIFSISSEVDLEIDLG